MGRYLTIDDLSGYKSMNFSSDTNAYNMHYSAENGLSLVAIARAGDSGNITKLSIRRSEDGAVMEITAETLARIDDFISGAYTPEIPPALFDAANFHRVNWSADGSGFMLDRTDNPELFLVSSIRYTPAVPIYDRAALGKFVADGDRLFGFNSIFTPYDEVFFENNMLVVLYVEEGSGSVTHEIGGVTIENGAMKIGVVSATPQGGTDDMLARFIVLECSKEVMKNVKSFVAYYQRTAAAPTPLADLPADYGTYQNREQAIADGVYVNVHGQEIYNQSIVDVFYENVFAQVPAFMRAINYTIEGDTIITDYQYDGRMFTVTTDSTRDQFGAQEITASTYKYLVPLGRLHSISALEPYYLSNEQNIFTGPAGGKDETLIDGLAQIPSPAKTANIPANRQ
jgi:hypothetical protein